ncbi:MAG: hypothetical protein A2W25_06130 [candidate division Zixibacteria bacterium RBG_16_53_22]|nr:MAG: hypothetical protein A2W25_06130 [candidate division Zixibacteria bacterium RBG_16_53_22]
MEKRRDLEAKDRKWHQKMIEIKVRFWTNDLGDEPEKVRPKHAWTSGVVRVRRNDTHGIMPKHPIPFNSLMELPGIIERALIDHSIVLHPGVRMKKYLNIDTK